MGDAAPVMHLDLNKFGCGVNFTTDTADVFTIKWPRDSRSRNDRRTGTG